MIPIYATLLEQNTNGKLLYDKFFKVIVVDVIIMTTILNVVLLCALYKATVPLIYRFSHPN